MSETTTINGEPCELITAFEQLCAGDVVYLQLCDWCKAPRHRALLLRPFISPVMMPNGIVAVMPGFPMVPEPHQVTANQKTVVSPPSVASRSVWRVIDPQKTKGEDIKQGHLDAQPQQTRRPNSVIVFTDDDLRRAGYNLPKKED